MNYTKKHEDCKMKIKSIKHAGKEHTWDFTTSNETYYLSNGVMSHNTSSKVANCTNGVEPVRSMVVTKRGVKTVAPMAHRLEHKYDKVWDQIGPKNYLKTLAVIQKWIDQTISTNTTYNLEHYPGNVISAKTVFEDILTAYKYGLKTLYYNNNLKSVDVDEVEIITETYENVISTITAEDDCESCKI
jgi:ribonucleoside-diphosphate reductase alpha chain